MGRAPCCEKLGLKKGRWTAEEDELLTNYIREHGEGSWRSLPKNAGLLRCGKSCRLRWINYLRADLKRGNITAEEEETIVKLHNALGNRWSLIAEHFPGRTDNDIKNYWNSHLSRKIYGFSKQHGKESPTIFMNSMAKLASRNRKVGSTKTSQPVVKKSKNMNYQVSTAKMSPMKPDQTDVMTLLDQSLATDQKLIGSTNSPGANLGQIEKLLGTKGKEEDGIDFSKGMAELGPNELLDREVKSLNYVIEGGVLDKPPTGNIDLKEKRESVAESSTTNEENKVLSGEAKEDQSEEWHTSSSSAMNSAFDEDGIWLDWNWEGCFNIESLNNGNEMWDLSEYEEGEKVFSLWESGTTQGNSGMDPTEKLLQVVQNQN